MAMEWKNRLTKTPYLVLFIFLGAIGVGTASALITITLDGDVIVTGDTELQGDLIVEGQADVTGNPIFSHRNEGANTANMVIERPGGPTSENTSFALSQRSTDQDLWLYGFDGTTFKNFVGFDFPNYKIKFPASSNTLVVDAANDKVGIGTDSPSSELEVVGNVTISGNLNVEGFSSFPSIYTASVESIILVGQEVARNPNCDIGDIAISGGFEANSFPPSVVIRESYKRTQTEWETGVINTGALDVLGIWETHCLDVSSPFHVP